jgi:GxxExxY protein
LHVFQAGLGANLANIRCLGPETCRGRGGTRLATFPDVALADIGDLNDLTSLIIKAAIEVHRQLGPGLLESAYLACLSFELRTGGLDVQTQVGLPLVYKDVKLDCGYRVDLIVSRCVVVEVKCVDQFAPIHHAQLLTYLKLTKCEVGLLLNFKVPVLKSGLKRVLNTLR